MALSAPASVEHASLVRPCQGEQVSGDATVVLKLERGLFVAIVDVLGHGPEAAQVAGTIRTYLERYAADDVCGLMSRLHEFLRGTRGAAVGLCALDTETGQVVYAGIGNTVIRRLGGGETRLVSLEGVVGQNMRSPRPQELVLDEGDVLVLYTDGVQDRFTAEEYPEIKRHAVKDVVRVIIERFGKDYDDAACIALRYGR